MSLALERPASDGMGDAAVANSEKERMARLRLSRSENVGPRSFSHLLKRFGSASAAVDALPDLALRGGRTNYIACSLDSAEAEMEAGRAAGATLLTVGEAAYPSLLAAIDSAPPVLWIMGDPAVLARSAIGIVGARNASALGLRTTRRIVSELTERGHVIVSGLARGVDAAAHEAALTGGTVAVMAGGVDRTFPRENQALAERIVETGLLISECPIGTEPTSRHFPRRNRLISGLSRGVVLIEAAIRSGSLITARYALEQGREVMACPGAPEDPRTGGCNKLIRDGAALIRNADDVIDALEGQRAVGLAEPETLFEHADMAPLDVLSEFEPESAQTQELAEQVAVLLGPHPIDIDELERACGASHSEMALALLELDIAGRVDLLPGGSVVRTHDAA